MNKQIFTHTLAFGVGVGIGVGVSYFHFKKTYNIIDDEYYSMLDEKEERERMAAEEEERGEEQVVVPIGDAMAESLYSKGEEVSDMANEGIYLIAPEDLGNTEYEVHSLDYFADGKVADEEGELVENAEELIGNEALDHFGEYEEDSVFVRNDILAQDFEVLRDYRKYVEAYGG